MVNKNNPGLWGIALKMPNDVFIKDKNGNEKTIAANGVIPIVNGLKIKFNDTAIGEILTN